MSPILAGFLLLAAFPNPLFHGWNPWAGPLEILGLALLLWKIPESTIRAFVKGYIFGAVWFAGLLYWMPGIDAAGAAVAISGYVFLIFYLSCFPALFLGLLAWAFRGQTRAAYFVAPFIWVALEFLRTHLFSGFPWGILAQALAEKPGWLFAGTVAGPYGPAFLISLSASIVVLVLGGMKARGSLLWSLPAAIVGLFLCLLGLREFTIPLSFGKQIRVALLQGAVDQSVKWTDHAKNENIILYAGLQKAAKQKMKNLDLVVWPEAAATVIFEREEVFSQRVRYDIVNANQVPTIIGAPSWRMHGSASSGIYTNSAQLWIPGKGKTAQYDKMHLVPLGEYVPLGDWIPSLRQVAHSEGAGGFTHGEEQVLFSIKSGKILPSICYEIIFPNLIRKGVQSGGGLLVNLTNDDWYGATAMPAQHLAFSVLRAVENGIYVARCANSGFSAFIDPKGQLMEVSELGKEQILTAIVRFSQGGTWYSRHGDMFAWACAVLALLILARARQSIIAKE